MGREGSLVREATAIIQVREKGAYEGGRCANGEKCSGSGNILIMSLKFNIHCLSTFLLPFLLSLKIQVPSQIQKAKYALGPS